MYKGAVFFDYDGTLTDENEGIFTPTDKTCETLSLLRRNGYLTFLATGRMKPCTTLVSGKFSGLVTCNGAYVEVDGECIKNTVIDSQLQAEAIRFMEENNICYALETQTGAYTNGLENKHFISMLEHFNLAKSIYSPIPKDRKVSANKMSVTYESEADMKKLADKFRGRLVVSPHRFFLSADLDAENVTKADGIVAVMNHFGIPKEHIYAVGDGSNDLEMIKTAGHGIAMGNHSPMLDGNAEFYTKSVKEEGITYALREYYKLI